ncbi:hypothetical protein QYF36_012601 [Acer negundo]|nr:hypothetical protein QYF36_012601 [Acer negundo]
MCDSSLNNPKNETNRPQDKSKTEGRKQEQRSKPRKVEQSQISPQTTLFPFKPDANLANISDVLSSKVCALTCLL